MHIRTRKLLNCSKKQHFSFISTLYTNYIVSSEATPLMHILNKTETSIPVSQAMLETFHFPLFSTLKELNFELIDFMSQTLGFSLGASIIALTFLYRIALLWPNLLAISNSLKMQLLQAEVKEMTDRAQAALRAGNIALYKQYQSAPHELYKKHGIKLSRNFYNLFTIPAYVSLFLFFRELTYNPSLHLTNPELSFMWVNDITQPDPYFIFPFVSAIFSYLLIKLNNNTITVNSPYIKKFRVFFQFIPFFGILPLATFPAGLNIYWFTLAFLNYLFYFTASTQACRRLMNVPEALLGTVLYDNIIKNRKKHQKAVFIDDSKTIPKDSIRNINQDPEYAQANDKVVYNSKNGENFPKQNFQTISTVKVFRHKPKQVKK